MIFCPITRAQLLAFLPKNATVAEIGVAEGHFSQTILQIAQPARLHLIDPWIHQETESYAKDINNVSDGEQESRFQAVCRRFQAETASGQVVIQRAFSGDALKTFQGTPFDWIYIDALHTFEGVWDDLTGYDALVKEDGFILGHDYTNHQLASHMGFGVIEAVDRFVRERGYHFLALTAEDFPTYLLARRRDSPAAQKLIANLYYHLPLVMEIEDHPDGRGFKQRLYEVNGKKVVVSAF
ncbi:MAG: class I SAM-dependent methyltransferase [Magnetococcales bacterium]|nr:class I SAM-dependent methyltransferase [Magnetococcales bacterium]